MELRIGRKWREGGRVGIVCPMSKDVYLKKVISFKHRGKTLRFAVSQDLFSSFQVDTGTRFLLRTVMPSGVHSFEKVLDLGCGYGPLGLALKSANEAAVVYMVDRDALAVEFSRRNAELNGLSGIQAYGSLGYDDVRETDFDLIISNIPGKAGEPVIRHFLTDARYFLGPGGLVAVVVVGAIESMVKNILENTPGIAVTFRQARSGHVVFHYRFDGESGGGPYLKGFERGIYDRNDQSFHHHDMIYPMRTARGLPEFNSLNFRTGLLLEGLHDIERESRRRTVVINPGQGHVPAVIWRLLRPDSIALVDRDLLSLRCSRENLFLNGCTEEHVVLEHAAGFPTNGGEPADLIAGILREDEGPGAVFETVKNAAGCLAPEGLMVLAAGSTAITRLIKKIKEEIRLEVVERTKRRGNCLIILRSHSKRD